MTTLERMALVKANNILIKARANENLAVAGLKEAMMESSFWINAVLEHEGKEAINEHE